jgi:hypothetical protein
MTTVGETSIALQSVGLCARVGTTSELPASQQRPGSEAAIKRKAY